MKKLLSHKLQLAAIGTMLLCLASCSQGPDTLSAGTVETLVNELLAESGQEQSFTTVQTGVYELNSPAARAQLMRLKAAGVVNYDVKRYAWWNKTLSISNFYKYYETVGVQREKIGNTYYDFEEHFVVTVSLTDQARQYQVDSIPQPKAKEDEDMKQPDISQVAQPELSVKTEESWPYIPNPEAPRTEGREVPQTVTIDLAETEQEEPQAHEPAMQQDEDYDLPQRMSLDIATSMAYEEAVKGFHQEQVILKSSKLAVKKARFLQVYDDPRTGVRSGSAEIIIEMSDVTDAGRVLEKKFNGIRFCSPVSLIYYTDKGWILQDRTLHLQPYSNLGIAVSAGGSITGADATEAVGTADDTYDYAY